MVSYEAEGRPRGPLQGARPRPATGRRAVTGFGPTVDAAVEACVVPGFSRIGLAVRSRLLPEYTADDHSGLDGRTILITGVTSGSGYAAAVALARRGAAVHFLARDRGRAERARRGIAAASGSTSISYGLADLEDLDAVRVFACQFCATHDRLGRCRGRVPGRSRRDGVLSRPRRGRFRPVPGTAWCLRSRGAARERVHCGH